MKWWGRVLIFVLIIIAVSLVSFVTPLDYVSMLAGAALWLAIEARR